MFKIKNVFNEWYQPHDSFVMRNPLFPAETFFNWCNAPGKSQDDPKEALRKFMKEFYRQPVAQEALYIGSPDLHAQLLLWLDDKIEKPDKRERTELSLVKYMIRMCTRCTPYGLFASCTFGEIADKSNLELGPQNALERNCRLDMDYVCEAYSYLLKHREISGQLRFFPNTSIYPLGDQLRYIEQRFQEKTGRSYHLVQIERSVYLDKILLEATDGCIPERLASVVVDDEITREEALEFIYELINSQVLVSELEPNVTGEEYFKILLTRIRAMEHTQNYITTFEKVLEEFDQIKSSTDQDKGKFYSRLVEQLQQLEITLHLKTLIQVDSYRPANGCTLKKEVVDEILNGASLLQLLTTDSEKKDSFSEFKNAFRNRYESQWIPLVEVLDTESGIGYGKFATTGMEDSPLIDKLPIGNGVETKMNHEISPEAFIWQLYQEAITGQKTEVVIEDRMLEKLTKENNDSRGLPDSFSMMVKINATTAEDLDNGNYQITIQSPSGPSGGNLLGRFCHLNPSIEKFTQDVLRDEEKHQPDCIFAEIVHLPESRIGNILMRPVLRSYEIPYLCGSALERDFQIPVADLLVGVENNQVVLRSRSLNKQVIPRMTTAHNFNMTTLPVYQFLCDLQFQQARQVGWRWGILENRPFLPGVRYGKYILSKARWILMKDDVKDFDKKNETEIIQKFSELAKEKRLPEYVMLSQGDNELMLHLKNYYCIKLLLNELNKNDSVRLTDTSDMPEKCLITSPDGHHAGEFIVAFTKKTAVKKEPELMVPSAEKQFEPRRYFPIGSEWLYAKIYCGTKTAEKILCEVLKPFTEELVAEGIIDKYFFLRYHDEGHHIRIRFHQAQRDDFWKEVIDRLRQILQPHMQNHTVSNLQFETYQREIERYGTDTMEISEELFYIQSTVILNFLSLLVGDEGEQYRWLVSLKALDLFLEDFQYTLEQKRDLIKSLHTGFSDEFNVKAAEQKKISERFSSNKKLVQQVMGEKWEEDENLHRGISVFSQGSDAYKQVIAVILKTRKIGSDRKKLDSLMASYLHMFINRMFVSNQRKVELVIYDHLLKYYEAKMAMERNKNKPVEIEEANTEK